MISLNVQLHHALLLENIEDVQALIEAGADIEVIIDPGYNSLVSAASRGIVEIVKILLEAGADIEAVDRHGDTPLFSAATRGHVETVKILLEAGADIEAVDRNGDTPLFSAAKGGHVEIVKILLEAGASKSFPIGGLWSQEIINLFCLDNCDELRGEVQLLKTLLTECNVSKSALKDQLVSMEEEIADISATMSRVRGQSVNDKRDIEILKGIQATLEEKIGLLNTAVDNGTLDNSRLVKEITTLKKEIVRLSNFSSSRDNAGGSEESTSKGFECVKPFTKSNATRRSRLDSCVPVEGGMFDNIRTADGGRFTNKQKCIEVCHTDN